MPAPIKVRASLRYRSIARQSRKAVRMDGEQDGAQAQGAAVEEQQSELRESRKRNGKASRKAR